MIVKNGNPHSYPLNKKELTSLGLKIENIEGDRFERMKILCHLIHQIQNLYNLKVFIDFTKKTEEK